MNDYIFGNKLTELRRQAGLSQKELADYLGVTDKAVSKWETGAAKPRISLLRRLSSLYHISVEKLLNQEESHMPQISKIVITGGPCAGKTTAMSWIQNAFTAKGYTVLFVPETATELISGGVAPWTCRSNQDYQVCQMTLQQNKEAVFEAAAQTMTAEKVLIVCDRGMLDNKAYMTDLEFSAVLGRLKADEVTLRDSYDAVFHLVTAANGAEEFYTTANNAARTETPQQAVALDDRIISAWTGHPHLRVIDNSADFSSKMLRLIGEISAFLGEPEPYEIERKYLIRYPDLQWLESLPNCSRVEIIQTYLKSPEGSEVRIRQRGLNGNYIYFKTEKREVTPLKRVETEQRLTQQEYLTLLMDADPSRHPIRKTRYCLTWDGQYFEIDVYPFWQDQAIVEIELRSEDTPVHLPEQLQVIREVTQDPAFKNAALAQK